MNLLEKVTQSACTGCEACKNICPVNAIDMISNGEGFLYPFVNEKLCIDCGKCYNCCPVVNLRYNNKHNPQCFAAYANDDIRLKSASGGIYTSFALYVIEKLGGFICGAAFVDGWKTAHILGNNSETLRMTQNSKYMQSTIGFSYREVKKLLMEGKNVLFSGTPCQVAGIYSFLGKEKYVDQLYTMDLVCHGVPSSKLFHKYLKETYDLNKISSIDFRAKDYYGWCSSMTVTYNDGTVHRNTHDKDMYYKAFLPCLALRKSCEVCPFSRLPRQGDITIGDFWGIDAYDADLNDKKGLSVVLVNNEKGHFIMEAISEQLVVKKEIPLKYALSVNKTIMHPYHAHFGRKHFFNVMEEVPMKRLVENALEEHYDIGIVGPWYGLNYGSILTYYALYQILLKKGYDPVLLTKPNELWDERYDDKNSIAYRFIKPRCNIMDCRKKSIMEINMRCNAFIVGSDVVWNYNIFGTQSGGYFFLDFVEDSKTKISYASSFGGGYNAPEKVAIRSKYYLKKFDAISVREDIAVEICKSIFGVDAVQVLDPVFLCNKNLFCDIAQNVEKDYTGKIMAYMLAADKPRTEILKLISNELKMDISLFANPNNPIKIKKLMPFSIEDDSVVENWIKCMTQCEFYVGDSFHGMCMAIIFHKNFIVIRRNRTDQERFLALLRICGLENRIIFFEEESTEQRIKQIINKDIDYEIVDRKLATYIEFSKQWLDAALGKKKSYSYNLEERVMELEEKIDFLEKTITVFTGNMLVKEVNDSAKKWSKICIYGIGGQGKRLLNILNLAENNIVAICDNYVSQPQYKGIKILNHEECVKQFQDAIYIITVQNDVQEIRKRLIDDGILKKQIKFFDTKRIVD